MARKQTKTTTREQQAQRVGIFGASGSGKTTKARELTGNLTRVIFFDSLQEWKSEKGVKVFYDLDTFKKGLIKDFVKGFRFVFCPQFGKEKELLSELCLFLIYLQDGFIKGSHKAQLTLCVDELDRSFPSGIGREKEPNYFHFLCCRGRHYGVNLIGISQRTAKVDVEFRGNLSIIFLYRHNDPIDYDNAVKMVGRDYKETLRQLNNYEYICKVGEKIIIKR